MRLSIMLPNKRPCSQTWDVVIIVLLWSSRYAAAISLDLDDPREHIYLGTLELVANNIH